MTGLIARIRNALLVQVKWDSDVSMSLTPAPARTNAGDPSRKEMLQQSTTSRDCIGCDVPGEDLRPLSSKSRASEWDRVALSMHG